jgi:fatty acid desaturase
MSDVTATMVPTADLLTPPDDGVILPSGRAVPSVREHLRRIPSWRNALSVVSVYVQTAVVFVAVAWIGPWAWLPGLVLMARAHAQFAALMHEAAHRLLFRNRRLNDWVGRWLLGYPSFTPTDAYRRVHMAHHRQEFGPDEPDLALYNGYPITSASLRRKLVRDATGRTGWKLLKPQLLGVRSADPRVRRTVWSILAVQALLLAVVTVAGYPILYVLWVGSYLTVWRVINRLRSIAEHGGMKASPDRRETTHSVRQHWVARSILVPYHIGWHLAHHCDSGVPFRNLPRYHRLLEASGYVTPELEHASYRALWRKLSSRSG